MCHTEYCQHTSASFLLKLRMCVRNSWNTCISVFTIQRPKGASATRACGVLMVKILNKCILSILVFKINFKTNSVIFYIYRNISIYRYIGCLHEKEIQNFPQNYLIRRNKSDTNCYYVVLLCLMPNYVGSKSPTIVRLEL